MRLAMIPGVGPRLRQALLERFGSAAAVLAAAPSELREVQGIGSKLARIIAAAVEQIAVEQEISLCRQQGIEILTELHDQYPRMLREIHDPPGVLFVRGNPSTPLAGRIA